jgi:SulP family sulfate permease
LTVALILLLERTMLGPLGLVLAVVITSALVAVLGWGSVALVRDLSEIPRALPQQQFPSTDPSRSAVRPDL